jgi:hypothetical protein
MSDAKLHETLIAMRDVGLQDPDLDAVDARCGAALRNEFERERRRTRPRLRRHVRRAVVVPLSLMLVAALGAAGYAALTSSSTASAGIECHLGSTLDSSGTITHLDGRPATETCRQLYATGAAAAGAQAAPAPLHACVQGDGRGAIHVFASRDSGICARVGLREDPTAGTDEAAARYGRFAAQLFRQLNSAAFACPTPLQVRRLVESELRASGLADWTINDTGGYDQARSCAALTLDSESRRVTLSPIGR